MHPELSQTPLRRAPPPSHRRLERLLRLLFPVSGNPSTTTAHRRPLAAVPLALLLASAAGYTTSLLLTVDVTDAVHRTPRVVDSVGHAARPHLDSTGVYTEEQHLCSPPVLTHGSPQRCSPSSALEACDRCVDGRCFVPTKLALAVPAPRWKFVDLPRIQCSTANKDCPASLFQGVDRFDLEAGTTTMHATVYTTGGPVHLQLCATARYYPPWTREDWQHDPPPGG
jgi:hypothetical protein